VCATVGDLPLVLFDCPSAEITQYAEVLSNRENSTAEMTLIVNSAPWKKRSSMLGVLSCIGTCETYILETHGKEGFVESALTYQSALFNFQSLLVVLLLLICTCQYIRCYTGFLENKRTGYVFFHSSSDTRRITGSFWRAGRIGERASEWVALGLVIMSVVVLFQ
jgi:hypothetical protein